MRRPSFYRPLMENEKNLVRGVFWSTLPPWDQIAIGDGLGGGDRPWTDIVENRLIRLDARSPICDERR